MRRRVSGWWATQSLSLRLTLIATLVMAVGLVCGTTALAAIFYHNRVGAVDANVRDESSTLVALVDSGQLPDPLPAGAGQPVLAQVIDRAGTVQSATVSASRVVPILPPHVLVSHRDGSPFTSTESSLGGQPIRVIVASARLDHGDVMVVSAVAFGDVDATLDALLRTLVIAVPLILLAAGLATWLAVRSALRPVDELRSAADQVADAQGNQPPHLPVPASDDEIARLARTLNQMLQRLHDTAARQEAFIADAAHELRSPIASIRTQIEVALSLPTDAAQWEATGTGVLHDVERVGRLADDLLLLARMDAGAPLQREVVDISRLFELDLEPLWVEAEPRALRRAFDNLVANARRHARQRVEVTARAEAHEIIVDIDDDGVGVPVADRERVFDRWLRLDEARARDQGGSGLGLAIAKSVAAGHGGDVVILDSPLGGARLRLRLPMAPRPSSSAVALTLRSRAEPGDPAAAPQRGDR